MARVLVLEDDPHMRELLAGVLEDEGYGVVAVGRGEEAVERAAAEAFDLVVLDVRMEGIDGLEALARMQQHLQGAATLVVTGYASEADSIRALRLGVGDYLRKPFELPDFLDRAGRLLSDARRRRRQEALRRLGPWAAETLARSLEGREVPPGAAAMLARAGRRAASLAAGAGHESPEEVHVAAVLLGARRLLQGAVPEPEECPPAVADVLLFADERWDGTGEPEGRRGEAIPLAARVADLAVAAAEGPVGDPGRFDPALLEALEPDRPAPPTRPDAVARGLLGLGRTLLGAGDRPSARRAFTRVAEAGGREAVEAWLCLAETARQEGRPEQVAEHVRNGLEAAREVGPAATARASLDGGLLLLQAGRPEAGNLLGEAAERLARLGLEGPAARARLALRPEGAELDGALNILMRQENEPELAGSAAWLLPLLLERGLSGRPVQRLVRDAPRELFRLLQGDGLSPAARRAAAALLDSAPRPLPPDLLDRLKVDPDPQVRRRAQAASGAAAVASVLRVQALGALEVHVGEERVDERAWRSARVKFLFAYLVLQGERSVVEDRIIDEFWPEDAEKGRRGIYWSSSVIRRCLRGWGSEPVVRARGLLSLNPELPRWHDVDELERSAAAARATRDRGAAKAAWTRVVSLYRAPYLEGCYMDWALNLRTRVDLILLEALNSLHEAHLEAGQAGEALECARRLVELDPLVQESHLKVMQCLTALGRPTEAMRQYESCRRVLERELGMEPGIEMLEAYHRARLML